MANKSLGGCFKPVRNGGLAGGCNEPPSSLRIKDRCDIHVCALNSHSVSPTGFGGNKRLGGK